MFRLLIKTAAILFIPLLLANCAGTPDSGSAVSQDIKLQPQQKELFADAVAAMKKNKLKKARGLLQKLLQQQPNIANIHVNIGIILSRQKAYSEAENAFNRALQLDPDNIYALNYLGVLQRQQGKFADAEKYYKKAIDIDSDYTYPHLNLGILYDLYMYRLDDALEQYQQYQELTGEKDKLVGKWIIEVKRRLKAAQTAKK